MILINITLQFSLVSELKWQHLSMFEQSFMDKNPAKWNSQKGLFQLTLRLSFSMATPCNKARCSRWLRWKNRMFLMLFVFLLCLDLLQAIDMKLLERKKKKHCFYLNFAPSLHSEVAVPSPGLLRKGSPPWNHTKPCSRIAGVELTGHWGANSRHTNSLTTRHGMSEHLKGRCGVSHLVFVTLSWQISALKKSNNISNNIPRYRSRYIYNLSQLTSKSFTPEKKRQEKLQNCSNRPTSTASTRPRRSVAKRCRSARRPSICQPKIRLDHPGAGKMGLYIVVGFIVWKISMY